MRQSTPVHRDLKQAMLPAAALFWAVCLGVNVMLLKDAAAEDFESVFGIALICEGAIYLALWALLRGLRWAFASPDETPAAQQSTATELR